MSISARRRRKFKTYPRIAQPPAPGARLEIRGEEWVLRRADRTFDGHFILSCMGITPLVRDYEYQFLTEYTPFTEVNPKKTQLKLDKSSGYAAAKLHIESHLRMTPPTDDRLYLGNRGAMDDVPYQRVPALMALEQPKPRILIADGTGLGKTLEAGILMAELIRRGRGRRILVVTLNSMLTQFQKEMWSRFTIPLVRLDSVGINRVKDEIPVGHNPFDHFQRSIISIDTLKNARAYREYIEKSYWDIIVIDEAQNVALRGTRTLRNRLADLLATRSDALIMLSATPHDGRARSFASLINMLDPTVIADPENYTRKDFEDKNLFVRRFKKDIRYQVSKAFQERKTTRVWAKSTEEEESAFAALTDTSNQQLGARAESGWLLRTVLEKAVLSSPAACLETLQKRIKTVTKKQGAESTGALEHIATQLERITLETFSKYQRLLELLRAWEWDGKDPHDRVVIFTERIATQDFLQQHIVKDLGLKPEAALVLKGHQSDIEQQEVVDKFGSESASVRILLSTDVGSEGINLHYHCCKLIHFDIPWSIMRLQQRNGRIDRYGQHRTPQIYYLLTESENEKFAGDHRILELLIEKENQAEKNIGDPASFIGVYDIKKEEDIVRKTIERGISIKKAEVHLVSRKEDPLAFLFDPLEQAYPDDRISHLPSLYDSDYAYLKAALTFIRNNSKRLSFGVDSWNDDQRLQITAPEAMHDLINTLPVEARPKNGIFDLTGTPQDMMKAIKQCIAEEGTWPAKHYLWPLHPIMDWATDKVRLSFNRLEAPIIVLQDMESNQYSYIVSVSFPNRKGTTIFQKWLEIQIKRDKHVATYTFQNSPQFKLLQKAYLVNTGCSPWKIKEAQTLLPKAVDWAKGYVMPHRDDFEKELKPKLQKHLEDLANLRKRHKKFWEGRFTADDILTRGRKERKLREVSHTFDRYTKWIENTMQIEKEPYLEVIAVLVGA